MKPMDNNEIYIIDATSKKASKAGNNKSISGENLPTVESKEKITDVPPSKGTSDNSDISVKAADTAVKANLIPDLNRNSLMQGFIMAEILRSPKAKKWRGNTLWNSRF